jgi:two-component system response regulator MprA
MTTAPNARADQEECAAVATILVVEDDEPLRAAITDILSAEGYVVRGAGDGLAALVHLGQGLPALVLLDMLMPVVSGWVFANALQEGGVSVPVIIMTASPEAAQRLTGLRPVDVLHKPFELPTLVDAVRRALQGDQRGPERPVPPPVS